ncbi:phosphatase PAP2 family protein [Clostridium sp. WILCCON 0269]|uniref:Phosphatase PAP2 family protein n=1 Tax=Candidatus Clostridium eludens TaxID=3381663 RepID=A0ABW8SLI7_9CLOT
MYKFIEKNTLNVYEGKFSKLLFFIENYYFILIGLYFLNKSLHIAYYSPINSTNDIYMFALTLICFSAYSDIRKDVRLIPFLILCVLFFMIIFYINKHGYNFWGKMLRWQINRHIVINLNPIFANIPFNDGNFARIYKSETLTWFFRMVYNNGFVLPVLFALYRSAIIKDLKKMVRYALSAHILQIFLITPFYLTFHLQEVWYVLKQPDGLARHLNPNAAAGITLNCFPSMHTSISFAMFLLALREKNKLFKFIFGFFCLSIIYSTLYLEIHWILDVIAGMILGYITVKIVDFILDKVKILFKKPMDMFYYKNNQTTYEINNFYLDTMN